MFNYFVYFTLISIFKIFTDLLHVTESYIDTTLPEQDLYDFIVIGSGSSGGLIASNLKGKVLLIEAGGYGSGVVFNIPILQPMLIRSKYDWKHETVSQNKSCKAMNENKCFWPAGKIISGSHRLNNMIYHRPNVDDYEYIINDTIANKLFEEIEKDIPISETNFKSKLAKSFINGAKILGFDDFNYTKLTQFYGKRYTQFYNWWRKKSISHETILNAEVTKVIFDKKQAVGVNFVKSNKHHSVKGKNIVLSAGTLGSPKILLQSGVGPKKHLKDIGIKVIEDLPGVGENLQDHLTTNIDILLNQTLGCTIQDVYNPLKVIEYFWNGNGPLSLGGSDAMGFVHLNKSSNAPDLSFIFLPVGITEDYGLHLRKAINLRDDIWEDNYKRLSGKPMATILPILLHPKSRGNIRLKSKNYNDPVLIDPKYYYSREDIDVMIKAIRIIQKLIETPPMKEFESELIPKPFTGCENAVYDSNEYWECYVKHLTLTMYHPVGTCKMGEQDDSSTVVLKNFQVKNLKNLYVVDGSVIRNAPSSNLHALISLLAQKFTHDMNMIHND